MLAKIQPSTRTTSQSANGLGYGPWFSVWVLTFGLGYRTAHVNADFSVHPTEALIWFLAAFEILTGAWSVRNSRDGIPMWILGAVPFWIWAWLVRVDSGMPEWYAALSECLNVVSIVPLFVAAASALTGRQSWLDATRAFFVAGAWIAFTGVVEHLIPASSRLIPGFTSNSAALLTQEGFARAPFSMWGGPNATFICVLSLPFGPLIFRSRASVSFRVLVASVCALQVYAVYIGGYRSMWAVVVAQSVFWLMLRSSSRAALVVLVCGIMGFQFTNSGSEARSVGEMRAESLVLALQGNPIDTSARTRLDLASDAWAFAIAAPEGHGWGASGWVHSDLIQIAANQGIAAAALLVCALIGTFVRLYRNAWRQPEGEWKELGVGLFVAMIAATAMLAGEGVEVLPQMALPVWLVWVMSEIWIRQSGERRPLYERLPHLSTPPDVQLRRHGSRDTGIREGCVRDPSSRFIQYR